jgi:hypothetical protein
LDAPVKVFAAHVAEHAEDDEGGVEGGEQVGQRHLQHILLAVVLHRVVGGERNQTWAGEGHTLCGEEEDSIVPLQL